ncbi:RNA dependent RNA polymerase-domain-containing protein [Syncephalis fuscata]|nr:RNA dependent RNA polymerase-domain-containing protein [Syncephalis fuscata]
MDELLRQLVSNTLDLSLGGELEGRGSQSTSIFGGYNKNYTPLKYLVVAVEHVPASASAADLHVLFSEYGRVFSLNLERSEYDENSHSGHATVCYQPVPNPWPEFLKENSQPLLLYDAPLKTEVLDDGYGDDDDDDDDDDDEAFSWSSFKVETFEIGSQITSESYMSCWKFNEGVRKCRISFKHLGINHRFELGVNETPNQKKANAQLECFQSKLDVPKTMPPRIWQYDDKSNTKSRFNWSRQDQWKRITRMHTTRWPQTQIKSGNTCSDEIMLGKWLDYRLHFRFNAYRFLGMLDGGQLYGIHRLPEDKTILVSTTDAESTPHSGWILPTNEIFTQMPIPKTVKRHEVVATPLDSVNIPYFSVRYLLAHYVTTRVFSEYSIEPREKSEELAVAALKNIGAQRLYSNNLTTELESCMKKLRTASGNNESAVMQNIGRSVLPDYCVNIRKAIITPTKVFLLAPTIETSNRVLRKFPEYGDHFMRVQFLDENFLRIGASKRLHVLQHGIHVAAFSSSQLREHGCWFFASDYKPGGWMGDFSKIKQVARYAARTKAVKGLKIDNIGYITDVEHGVGCTSPAVAEHVKEALGLSRRPSGCKGMFSVDPVLTGNTVFDSTHTKLEIVRHAVYAPGHLNRQVITLLTTLNVPSSVILERKDQVVRQLDSMLQSPATAIRVLQRNLTGCPVTRSLIELVQIGMLKQDDPYVYNLLRLFRACAIIIDDSVSLLGILDETGKLGANEIFVQFVDPLEPNQRRVIVGRCALFRNPAIHPGDIRVVKAVDVPELYHYVDCIVFSQHGIRDTPSQCGGGDLDGDEFTCIWDQELIPSQVHPPMSNAGQVAVNKDYITMDDIKKFFVDYIVSDNLGQISNAHMAQSDQQIDGAKHHICLELARLHSYLRPIRFPDFMNKSHLPNYVSKSPLGQIYRSITLSDFKPATEATAEKQFLIDGYEMFINDAVATKRDYDATIRDVMQQFEINTEWEIISGWILTFSQLNYRKAHDLRIQLVQVMRGIQREFLRRFEAEFNEDFNGDLTKDMRSYPNDQRMRRFASPTLKMKLRQKAAAWYFITYDKNERQFVDNSEHLFSFPWIVHHYLCENARDYQKKQISAHAYYFTIN